MRCLLSVPDSTPIAALNWDCGMFSVEYRVIQKKILFIHYLVHLDEETLAKQIFSTQKKFSLPGFVNEGRNLLNLFNLPNIVDNDIAVSKLQWKNLVRTAIQSKFEEDLQSRIKKSSKLKHGPMCGENFEVRDYIRKMPLTDARTMFRVRSSMTDVKLNQQSNKLYAKQLWKCSECGNIDSQSHILWCPFHAELREGKSLDNDGDLVKYMQQVFKVREDLRLSDS